MKKDTIVFLQHILDSISKIEEFTKGMSKAGFIKSVKTQDAVIRRSEIIGEAVKNLPKDFIEKYPEINWAELARMRDKLIHGYFGLDLNITWNVIKEGLHGLSEKIKEILRLIKAEGGSNEMQ